MPLEARDFIPPLIFLGIALYFAIEWQVIATVIIVWFGLVFIEYLVSRKTQAATINKTLPREVTLV